MRFDWMTRGMAFLASAALFAGAPLSANALGVSIVGVSSSGGNVNLLSNGDIITFDLRLENATNEDVFGLGVGVWGYDVGQDGVLTNDHLRFVAGGAVANRIFKSIDEPAGLSNIRTAPTQFGRPAPFFEERRVQLFDGVNTIAYNGDGSLDPAVGGGLVGDSPTAAHFRLSFQAVAGLSGPAVTNAINLVFGNGRFGNVAVGASGSTLAFNNAAFTVNVVPEPGTALLMGLGLAGLAARGRR